MGKKDNKTKKDNNLNKNKREYNSDMIDYIIKEIEKENIENLIKEIEKYRIK